MTDKALGVTGMSCGNCKAAVEGESGKRDGVEHSNVDRGPRDAAGRRALHAARPPSGAGSQA